MVNEKYTEKISQELQKAYDAQVSGKEGLARVCARRATGWAIKEKLNLEGISLDSPSAIDHIRYLLQAKNTEPEVQRVLQHMLQKVAKDSLEEDSYWPLPDINLVNEAQWLIEYLLGISIPLQK